jgi:hypothetical protein
MCPSNDREKQEPEQAPKQPSEELESLLANPPPALDELFDDPTVRWRIGEWISLAMNRTTRRPRRRSSRPERPDVRAGPRFRG